MLTSYWELALASPPDYLCYWPEAAGQNFQNLRFERPVSGVESTDHGKASGLSVGSNPTLSAKI